VSQGPSETPPAPDSGQAAAHPLLALLTARFSSVVLATHAFRGDATAIVDRGGLLDVCRFLRDDPETALDMLMDVTVVDYMGRQPRFEVVYHLYSIPKNHRIRIKVPLEESDPSLPSVVPLWAGADWLERESFDMYGVRFDGHPNLKRIYLYEQFEGHPLRKDYPKEKRQPLVGPDAVHRDPLDDDLSLAREPSAPATRSE
jgi:NADH-quinone oxidoreductase subunit C